MGQPALDTPQAPRTGPAGAPIDWAVAAVTAQRLLPAGPALPVDDAAAAVRQMRAMSVIAEKHVRKLTGLDDGLPPRPADVVDRPGWVDAAAEGLSRLLADYRIPEGRTRRVLATTTGMQVGVALAFLGFPGARAVRPVRWPVGRSRAAAAGGPERGQRQPDVGRPGR